jgi:hypothetical protein
MSDDRSLQTGQSDWRTRTLLTGGIIGSLIGVSAAYLYLRAAEEASEDGSPRPLATPEAVKLGMALLALVRQIADMGGKD